MSALPQEPIAANDSLMQASGLSRLLFLFQQMRRSETTEELLFLVMNETRQVITYDETFLFFDDGSKHATLQCISGIATFERETPKVAWLEGNIAALRAQTKNALDPILISSASLPASYREAWQEFMSAEAIIVPFRARKAHQSGFFLLTRALPWTEKDAKLLAEIAENFSYAYDHHQLKPGMSLLRFIKGHKNRTRLLLAALAGIAMFWPMHETLIADMEVTPISPWIATAPIDGVIRKIDVEPNAAVKTGDLLFEMDDTTLRNESVLADERLEIARQELRQAQQQVVSGTAQDDKKADAALLALEVQRKENEASYYKELLQKSKIFAEADGIAVFSAPSEIEGKPVHTGEAVMLIADQNKIDLTINMPANDAIIVKPGDAVKAYLNAMPFHPIRATVRYVSYKAQKTDTADQFAYKIKADLSANESLPRLGLKGTARVTGKKTTLFYVLFHKPIGYLRRLTGV